MSSNLSGKNLYAVLGIHPSADQKTIKEAFRTLAKKYHPDTNKGNKASEKKFKEVAFAYEILSDDKKRKDYDKLNNFNQPEAPKTDFSKETQAKQAYSKQPPPQQKPKEKKAPPPSPKESEKPFTETFSKFVNDVFSAKSEPAKKPIKGSDINVDLTITVHEAKNGTVRRVNVCILNAVRYAKGKRL